MCGRFALDDKANDSLTGFVEFYGVKRLSDWQPNWDIRPTDPIMTVIDSPKNGLVASTARWSLVPGWAKELKLKFPTFNARSEEAATKSAFAPSVKSKRALIPATGYYEWQTRGSTKTPYFIRAGQDDPVMFAGLYSWWRDHSKADDDESRWVLTATILTMDAAPQLAEIHNRNPVVLPRDWWSDWLNPGLEGDQKFLDAAVQAAQPVADALDFYEVAPLRSEGPGLIEPLNSL